MPSTLPQRPIVLAEQELAKLAENLTVGLIATHRSDLVCIEENSPKIEADRLMGDNYDQLPIIDKIKKLLGYLHDPIYLKLAIKIA